MRGPAGKPWRWWALGAIGAATLLGLAGPGAASPADRSPTPSQGQLSVLSYNVAGLPLGLSGSRPARNSAAISPLLNSADLVLMQEDFGYHDALVSHATHPHRSEKDRSRSRLGLRLGSGLERLSRLPFREHRRVQWQRCSGALGGGNDCLAPKGFSVARHLLAPGRAIDVYNWHADAKDESSDKAARRAQLRQLAGFIARHSQGRAVLVVGDSNSRYTRDGDILPELLAATGLRDVWLELERSGALPRVGRKLDRCRLDPGEGSCEHVDKILYRSGGGVELVPLEYLVDSERFRGQDGEPLSDHEPVFARFGWRLQAGGAPPTPQPVSELVSRD